MNTLGLRDPAYLFQAQPSGVLAPITTADVNTQAWYKADTHITESNYVGDKMDTTTNKASSAAPNFNLVPYGGLPFPGTGRGSADNDANFCTYSEDIFYAAWVKSNFTYNTATTGTFTAMGGYIRQRCQFTDESAQFTFKFKARAITGNTNLQILAVNAASANKTPVTLTGTLATYTHTFTGTAGSETFVGLQDDNAAGHGQIELTECQVYRSDHAGNYLLTTAVPRSGQRGGVPVIVSGASYGITAMFDHPQVRANAGPYTIYASVFMRYEYDGWFLCGNNPTIWGQIISVETATGNRIGVYNGGTATWQYGAAPNVFTRGAWHIVTVVYNGASSEARINKNTADAMNLGAPAGMSKIWVGGDAWAGTIQAGTEFHEIILRYTADNTATQDTFIDYMAANVGLSV